jgi:hypothetical protein
VEYCLQNPHWLSFNTLNSSENVFSLSFNIDVKSLPRQLDMVIGRKLFKYSTVDSTLYIYPLFLLRIECLKSKNKKILCAFVDFEKAFDKVWREALWYKLLLNNINGKMYRLILNMYDNIKSCVVYNNCKSDFFRCENGVRQGENLFPFLFSIFLNDLESYLQSKDVSGLTTLSEKIENQLNVYLKLLFQFPFH